MKLAEYLAEHIDQDLPTGWEAIPHLETIIQAGIEAFVKAKRKQVSVRDIPTDHLDELYP